jgi:PAT family beta-lactamase induction signal transducer AmpG
MSVMKKIFSYKMLTMLVMGYSAGLPLLLTGSTLQAWMTDAQVDLTQIGMVSLLGQPYVYKFIWSPLMDQYSLPFLGRRKGWILVTQILLALSIFSISFFNPATSLTMIALVALLVAFFSASQDIVIDAYRREILAEEELGLGSSVYIYGYRLAMIVSGAMALFMADRMSWEKVYQFMALAIIPAIIFTFFAPMEKDEYKKPRTLQEAVFGPLKEFFGRHGAWLMLSFILLYKLGDAMASNLTTPFILDLDYTKTDIATVAKTFGMAATLLGGFIGGVMMTKIPIIRSLWLFGILQAVSTFGFSILPSMPHTLTSLAIVIAIENLASGMGTAAYSAYMASITNRQFTATQYALLSSLMGIPRVLISAPTGWMAKLMGWEWFFVTCGLVAIPGLLLIPKILKLNERKEA